jgi:hypothetical protein
MTTSTPTADDTNDDIDLDWSQIWPSSQTSTESVTFTANCPACHQPTTWRAIKATGDAASLRRARKVGYEFDCSCDTLNGSAAA